MRNRTLGLFLLLAAAPMPAKDLIGAIDFYGYKGIDLAKVRADLPVHVGDPFSEEARDLIRQAVANSIGKEPTGINGVCCNESGDGLIYVGLPGESYKRFEYNAAPAGYEKLPQEIGDLYDKYDRAVMTAVQKGGDAAQEDDSQGYALIKDPDGRVVQLSIRAWAVEHGTELVTALNSASARDRRIASEALGYANQSKEQIDALVGASRDPDDEVRNNATRALGVLVQSGSKLAAQIQADGFIAMLNSGVWTDRNKAMLVLMALSVSRKPELVSKLRTEAMDSLIEMASWSAPGHAMMARMILGRVAGMPDSRIMQIAMSGSPTEIIEAARRQ